MKKMIALVLVLVMALSLAACGNKAADKTPLAGTMEENTLKVMEIAPVEFMGTVLPVDLADAGRSHCWTLRPGLDFRQFPVHHIRRSEPDLVPFLL